jgi:hypothetical protein
MTNRDGQLENNPSDPVEPNAESIIIGFGRGSYSALKDSEDSTLLFERFLDQSKNPSEPCPDIDGNFVDGDRRRKEFIDTLSDFYGSTKQGTSDSAMDGHSTKEEVIEKARNADTVELNATLYKILFCSQFSRIS